MGLDQCAYTRSDDQKPDEIGPEFVWRKHAKLQEWAENLFLEKTGQSADALNCGELELHLEDIKGLHALVRNNDLPESPGGFFYGHQFQEESAKEYREFDLSFCDWAESKILEGYRVFYSCWW